MHTHAEQSHLIENKSIDYVQESERHGKSRDLFTLWFCTNIAPLAVVTGAVAVQEFNLNFISALSAIIIGHLFGGIILGLTSAQGPQVGIPQMIQSRAQFGRYGSLLVVFFTTLIYLGFFISNIILSDKAIHIVVPAIELKPAIIIGGVSATFIAIVGYNFIHKLNKIGTWVMGISLISGIIYIFLNPLPSNFMSRGEFTFAGWFATFCIGAVWQISFSPYTSDYSRYLPKAVGIAKPFWYTYLGATLGTILAFSFGVIAVSAVPQSEDVMLAAKQATGFMGPFLMLLFLGNIVCHNSMNIYGAVLSLMTSVQTFAFHWRPSTKVRIVFSIIILIGSILVSLAASADFVHFFLNLIFALLSVLIPWAAINLIDFYIIKKHNYDVESIFRQDGGIYGLINYCALASYFIGILVQVPFVKNAFFEGVYANIIPGVDLSWMIGLVVTAVVYFSCAKLMVNKPKKLIQAGYSKEQKLFE